MSSPRYPVPPLPPEYRHDHTKKVRARGGIPLFELLSALFVVAALVMAFWLAALLLVGGVNGHSLQLFNLLFFWAVTAYLALPRVHQLFTLLYLPDYFIGRTRTADGVLGDPINLGLDGSELDLHAALRAAGWVRADDYSVRSVYSMIVSSLLRRSYPSAPVSPLFLFGRRHDFAYQQEVNGNPAERHHVRFWKVPDGWLLPGGQPTQWLAAATYDRAVGFSAFTGQITHKIDEDIDVERDYLVDTIRYADHDSTVFVVKGFSTAYHHRNGGGDRVRTDGDLPIVNISGAADRIAPSFLVDEQDLGPAIVRHGVPPVSLLIAGALVLARLAVAAVAAGFAGVRGAANSVLGNLGQDLTLALGLSLLLAILWWTVVARSRTGWLALMTISCFDGVSQLVGVDSSSAEHLSALLAAALAVCTVLSASAESVREWVSRGRHDPEVKIPEAARVLHR